MEKKAAPAGISSSRLLSAEGIKTYVKQHMSSALLRNAYYLMGSQVATSILSFIFWVVAARFYSTEVIGLAGAVLTMVSFIAGLADLGIGFGIIRFLPNAGNRANRMMNTGFTIQLLTSIVIGIVFLAGLQLWSPAMLVLQSSFIYLIGFILLSAMNTFASQLRNIFIASSASRFVMVADVLTRCVSIPALLMFVFLSGFFGVLGAQAAGFAIALIVCLAVILPKLKGGYHPRPEIDRGIAREIMPYSFGNFLGQMVGSIQFWLLPTIVLNILGAELNAFFYIGFSLSTAVWMIPTSLATSAFAESSHFENDLFKNIRSALKTSIVLDVIAVAVIFGFGEYILWLFGKQYAAEGIVMIRLFALAVFPMTFGSFLITWARVKKDIRLLVTFYIALAVVDIALILVLAPVWQLTGIGLAYLIGNTAVVAGAFLWLKIRPKGSKIDGNRPSSGGVL